MNWLERYAYAVKAYLPAKTRQDVADELLTDLQDERDHRAERLGRDLTDEETKALLKERGHPLLVAANFLPQKPLISEELFPIYTLLLKCMVIAVVVVQLVMGGMALASQSASSLWGLIPHLIWETFQTSLYCFAWITLIFHLFGESIRATDFFERWKPESLPKVGPQGAYISRTESAIEVGIMAYCIAWLNQIIPQSLGDNPIQLVFPEQWSALLPWANAVLLAALVVGAVKLIVPYWTRRKIIVQVALYLPTYIILAVIYHWDSAVAIQIGTGESARQFDLSAGWIALVILGYVVVSLIDIFAKIKTYREIT